MGRSRDHAGCQGIPFSYGITGPNGLPKARDGGGGAHDFFHSGQLRPLGGPHFPLPRAANERGGDLWHLGGALRGRVYPKSIPDGWKKCSLGNRLGRLITVSKWNSLEIDFPEEEHTGSKKSPFCIGIHLTFSIRAPGRSSGRSRDHAGSHGMLFGQGIAAPNGLSKARDGGGSAHDVFTFRVTSSPRRGPFPVAHSSK